MKKLTAPLSALMVALVVTLAPSQSVQAQEGMPPANVEVMTLTKKMLAATSDTAGSVISLNAVNIAAEVDGRLLWIAEVGTQVKKGDVIARLDPSLFQIQLEKAVAQVHRLKASLAFQESEVERQKQLSAKDYASKSGLQAALTARDMARADLTAAEAAEKQAARDLAYSKVKAPFDGFVAEKKMGVGSYLSKGTHLMHLVDTQALEVSLFVPIRSLPFVSDIPHLLVKDSLNQQRELPVRAVVPVSDLASRQVEMRLSKLDQDWPRNWIAGAPLTVVVPASPQQEQVALPREALIMRGSTIMVYKVVNGTQAVPVTVDPAFASGNWVALKGTALKVGDQVIIRGGERLQPGQPIQVTSSK